MNPSLPSILQVLRRRFWIVALCTILVPLSVLVFSLSQEEQYSASASLLFRDPELDQKLFGSQTIVPNVDPAGERATNVELVSLDTVSGRTAKRLGVDSIRENIEVAPKGQSNVVKVTAMHRNPQEAARIANAFGGEYIRFRRNADRHKIREAQNLVRRQYERMPELERSGPRGRSLAERAEQLQILASLQTGNAELVERATPPSMASSPKPARNMMVGAVLGVLLGIVLAFLRDGMDRRIRDPKEMEAIFERPIVGTIPKSRALARGGAALGTPPSREVEAFRMLRANLRYFNVDRDVKSLLVTSAAPGDGKTTVAWNLASVAAGAGSKVLLMEADLRHPSLAPALGLSPAKGLSTVLAGEEKLSDVAQELLVAQKQNGQAPEMLDVVPAGPLPPNPADLLESQTMQEVIKKAEREYDLVVIDTPPTSVVSDAIPLVNTVGGVVVVGRLAKSTRDAVAHLHRQLDNLDAPTLGVVVNAMGAESAGYGYGYTYRYGYGSEQEGGPTRRFQFGRRRSEPEASAQSPSGAERPPSS